MPPLITIRLPCLLVSLFIEIGNMQNFSTDFSSCQTGFIKSTDHRHTDHPTTATHSPNHGPTDHRPIDQPTRFYFKDVINGEYSLYRTQTQLGRCKTILRSIIYKIFIYLHKIFIFSFLRKKTTFLQKTYGGFNYVHFLHFKPNCCTPSQIFTVYFDVWKFQ